ncbi:Putative arsenical pump-driving ATPase [Candidatus Lokiarchaeum ossiferum]|uniref:Arsenical pump-driving ATPase n=1 Tax=Candidatus Lokiarchaeum ossiferum TaxID=2951803 RepID=A0ABY6HN84_9ARCH|nr:Putative arsenical pump-driving ATPase [Candidatus Lokiarchaeum sp. B-35]
MENLIIFGGKGGVGKSSISTATAVHLADQLQDQNVLLISFDIAHNLSDLFDKHIGNDVTQITKNLFAIEPDPDKYTKAYTGELTKKTQELINSSKIIAMIPDLGNIISEAVEGDNIPLALKNSLFFQSIIDAENPMEQIGEKQMRYKGIDQTDETPFEERQNIPDFDIIVCDFPPTGNMIALFEIPTDATQQMMRLTLKMLSSIQGSFNKLKKLTKWVKPASWMANRIVGDERNEEDQLDKEEQKNLAQEILDIVLDMEERSKRITQLMNWLGSLRLVSIAEKPSFEEAKRARELSLPYVSVDAIHINRLIPESERGNSPYLDNILNNQEIYQKAIRDNFLDQKVWESQLLDQPPIGIEGLLKLAHEIYGDTPVWDILNPLHRVIKNPKKTKTEHVFKIDEIRKKWDNA